jgi:hypothetical protein
MVVSRRLQNAEALKVACELEAKIETPLDSVAWLHFKRALTLEYS